MVELNDPDYQPTNEPQQSGSEVNVICNVSLNDPSEVTDLKGK